MALLTLLAPGCGAGDERNVPSRRDVQAALDDAVVEGVPGIAVEIHGPDGDEFLTAGVASLRSGKPIRPSELFRIASTTKAFTATIVMQLVSERMIGLDDHVEELVPGVTAAGDRITVRDLLGHTSGLPDYTKTAAFAERAVAGQSLTPRSVLRLVADQDLEFEPGTDYAYSDTDNIILGLIIEKVTANSYERELRTRILAPLGLRDTTLATSFEYPKPHVHGYQYDEGGSGEPEDVTGLAIDPNGAWASGALISTLGDVSRFFEGLLGGDLVPAPLLEEMMMTVPGGGSPPGPGTNNAGLGIFRWEISCGEIWGHTGSWPGYRVLGASSTGGVGTLAMVVNATNTSDAADEAIFRAQELAACRALGDPVGG